MSEFFDNWHSHVNCSKCGTKFWVKKRDIKKNGRMCSRCVEDQAKDAKRKKEIQELKDLMEQQQAQQQRAIRESEERHKQQMRQLYIQQQSNLQLQIVDSTAVYNQIHQKLLKLDEDIAIEEKSLINFDDEKDDPNAKIIILLGGTGDGKSTFGNRLIGDTSMMADKGKFKTSSDYKSCTQELSKCRTQVHNLNITVVDAPGWNDSGGKDRTHANNLCKYLRGCGGINQFVLVRNSTNYRFDDNLKQTLKRYESMFGKLFWSHLIVVLTRVEKGFAEQQFKAAKKDVNFTNCLCDAFNLDAKEFNIPVIPVGLDNYLDAIQVLVKSISDKKFECENIKSPLNDLKKARDELLIKDGQAKQKVDHLNQQMQNIQKEINSLR